jgi:hypothetical protein
VASVSSGRLVPAVMAHVQRLFLLDPLRRGNPSCPFDGLTFPTASPLHSCDALWCRSLRPACHRLRLQRPRLRSRLTLGRLALPRNPQAFGGGGSHTSNATHSGIRTSAGSTGAPAPASQLAERSPTIALLGERSTASVAGLSLAPLSARAHSTSELLRTLSMMAASKPTSWLSGRAHFLGH